MSARFVLRIVLVLLLLALLAKLPLIAEQFLYLIGKTGTCFLPGIFRVLLGVILVEATLVVGIYFISKPRTVRTLLVVIPIALLSLGYTAATARVLLKRGLLQQYAQGFRDRVLEKTDFTALSTYLQQTRIDLQTNDAYYKRETSGFFSKIKAGKPSVALIPDTQSSTTNQPLLVLWSCSGGGVGLYCAKTPLNKRNWIDQSLQLTNDVWIVVRGE